jgi:transcriptional regulator with XRE-family HTH domain
MISLIERSQSSPTAVLLEKLATGLSVPLASLFDAPDDASSPVSRRSEQALWRDPESGYVRRNISPGSGISPFQIVEVSFPARARVAYETTARDVHIDQQVWVLEGRIEIRVGTELHRLHAGDCLAMVLDQPIVFHNSSRRAARYAVVLATQQR